MRSLMARSYTTFGGKAVCDLGIQVAHEGNSYIGFACRRIDLIGLDMVLSAVRNTW